MKRIYRVIEYQGGWFVERFYRSRWHRMSYQHGTKEGAEQEIADRLKWFAGVETSPQKEEIK